MHALVVGGVSWNRIVHLDRLPPPRPHTVHARRTLDTLGGTGAGKAWNLRALGWDVELVAALGDDASGERARDELGGLGIDLRAVIDPSGTEQHTNLMAPGGERISIYTNASSPDVDLDAAAVVDAGRRADLVAVNILAHCRPVLAPLRRAGLPVWVDLHDYDGRDPHHRDFVEAATTIQVSSDRLPAWREFGDDRLASGADVVVVTHGRDGADANDGTGWRHVDARAARAVDANGAGDAFFAGFATAHLGGASVADALAAGAEAAARCVAVDGLGPPFGQG